MNTKTDVALDAGKIVMAGLFGWLVTISDKNYSILPVIGLGLLILYQMKRVPNQRLRNIHERLMSLIEMGEFSGDVRATIHRPIWRNRYMQVIDYAPTNKGARRKFPRKQGIVGKCLDDPSYTHTENFPDDETYDAKMVQVYDYSVEQSKKRAVDRRSYYAQPLRDGDSLIAVLYFDSTNYMEFPAERDVKVDHLLDELGRQVRQIYK